MGVGGCGSASKMLEAKQMMSLAYFHASSAQH